MWQVATDRGLGANMDQWIGFWEHLQKNKQQQQYPLVICYIAAMENGPSK